VLKKRLVDSFNMQQTLQRCSNQWKERIGVNTSVPWETKAVEIQKKWDRLMDAKVANYARIYPWFSNMTTHFVVAHERFLSVFDVNIGDWNHIDFKTKDGPNNKCKI